MILARRLNSYMAPSAAYGDMSIVNERKSKPESDSPDLCSDT